MCRYRYPDAKVRYRRMLQRQEWSKPSARFDPGWSTSAGMYITKSIWMCIPTLESHPCVVTFCHDVGEPVIDDDLDLDVGIRAKELCEIGQEDRVGDMICRGDPDISGRLVPEFAQR
jgi:hypothetical protein